MKTIWKRVLALPVIFSIMTSMAGCSFKQEKKPKPKPQPTVVVNNGNTDAKGKGEGQSDVPLVIGCNKLDKKFNPFIAKSEDDLQATSLTQLYLAGCDRQGQFIYSGIDGEVKEYNGSNYTYYGPADIKVRYNKKKDETVYKITLRDDIKFSDGEAVTIDDVLFTMYVLCDKTYKGISSLGKQDIKGLLKYRRNKKVKNIAGIKRINDYMMSITTNGYNSSMVKSLQIPICPLHYYGNTDKYNYNKNQFGFKKGDISTVCANKSSPVGAGPYRFVKYEKKIIYYTSNEIYYKGCPKIAYVQLKEMKGILKTAQNKIDKAVQEELQNTTIEDNGNAGNMTEEAIKPEDIPEDTFNHNAEALEMTEGTVDIINATLSDEDLFWIAYANSNGEISGNKINTTFIPSGDYQYIGINACNVKIGKKPYSKNSRNLRKAFATAFSTLRYRIYDKALIVQYPVSSVSWLSVNKDEAGYSEAYNQDINGDIIYNEDTSDEEKYENIKEAVLSYLEAAGYTITGRRVDKAPGGAKKSYSIIVDGGKETPLYQLASDARDLFNDIGIKLDIVTPGKKSMKLKQSRPGKKSGKKSGGNRQQLYLWTEEYAAASMDNLYGKYINSANTFGVNNSGIKKLLAQAEETVKDVRRKKIYKRCYKNIMELAVEVPICGHQETVLYSSARIDTGTIAKDITGYYGWVNEIENIEMK